MYFLADKPAFDFLHVEYGDESGGIDVADDLLEFRDFQSGNDAVEDILVIFQESALPVEACHGAVHVMDDGIADVVIACRDDEDALGGIKPCRDGINHARADEVRDKGIHGAVPAEDEARGAQDEEVEKHDDFADRKRRPAVHPDRHDFRAIRRPPRS